jgi:hypothetical protein
LNSSALALQIAMRDRLLAHAPLLALLGGGHVFDEVPRGEQEPYVAFAGIETRDWSVQDQKAHEHFVTLDVKTRSRSRKPAQEIVGEIETALDGAALTLAGHALVNLRTTFWTVAKSNEFFGAVVKFRAATEEI